MPRTSNDRPSQSQESGISPESKSAPSLMQQHSLTSVYTQYSPTLPLHAMAHCLGCGGNVAISRMGELICVTLDYHTPTKDAP